MPKLLEPGDELGLPWDRWADGRVWRLRKGREWLGNPLLVREAAQNAAARMGRAARVLKDNQTAEDVFWVQFADHEILRGDPCPCGSTDLRWTSDMVTICAVCGAVSFVTLPKPGKGAVENAEPGEADELLRLMLGTGPPAQVKARSGLTKAALAPDPEKEERGRWKRRKEKAAVRGRDATNGAAEAAGSKSESEPHRLPRSRPKLRRRGPSLEPPSSGPRPGKPGVPAAGDRSALLQLKHFSEVKLAEWESGDAELAGHKRTFYGHGRDPDGRLVLMVVNFPLVDGERRLDREGEGFRHRVAAIDVAALEPIVDVEMLSRLSLPLDPTELLPARQLEAAGPPQAAARPPGALTHWADVRLVPVEQTETVARYCGVGTNPRGLRVLMQVDVDMEDGNPVPDPDSPAGFRHQAVSILAKPFEAVIASASLERAVPAEELLPLPVVAEGNQAGQPPVS